MWRERRAHVIIRPRLLDGTRATLLGLWSNVVLTVAKGVAGVYAVAQGVLT